MSEANLFERIVSPNAVEAAMRTTLALWMNDYIAEAERDEGYAPGKLARPRGVITASEFSKWPEDQLPVLIVMSPGLTGEPVPRKGNGTYEASWSVAVIAIVSDIDEVQTRRAAGTYAAAIRAAVVQHQALGGLAAKTLWRDEKYADIPFQDTRTLDSCRVVFSVIVERAVTAGAGPREPSGEPIPTDPGDWPTASEVRVTTTPVPASTDLKGS